MKILEAIMQNVELVDLIVLALVGLVGPLLRKFILKKVDETNNKIDDAIAERVLVFAPKVAKSVWQTFVKSAKEAKADGKLTEEEKKMAMQLALRQLKSFFTLDELIAFAKGGSVETALRSSLEAAITEVKAGAQDPTKPSGPA